MKISIIGSGWLAQPLAKHFLAQDHAVILTTTQHDKVSQLQSKGFKALHYLLGKKPPDPNWLLDTDVLVIAITHKDLSSYRALMAQLSVSSPKHIIFISSTSVYQNDGSNHDEESSRLNPSNPLLAIETMLQSHPSTTIIRFAGLVGPQRHPGRFFTHGRTLKSPDAPVNLIHLDDCIGLIQAVITKESWGGIYNGCADTHPTKQAYYTHMADLIKLQTPEFDHSSRGSYKIINNTKSKRELSYHYLHPDVYGMTFI